MESFQMANVGSIGFMEEDEVFGIEEDICTPKKKMDESLIDEELGDISTPKRVTYNNELEVGTIFKTIEEARICYGKYAGSNGFSIRKKTTDKSKSSGIEIGILFVCCCEGSHQRKDAIDNDGKTKRLGSTSRTGCKAKMRLKLLEASGSWKVSIFNDVHNHELVTPSKRMHLKSNKIVPREATLLTEHFHGHNMRISKVRSLFGNIDQLTFDNRDLYNHMKSFRKINYDEGDAERVRIYFQKMAAENPLFYYAIQCDDWGRAMNFFWIDGRSRLAYTQFGDAITFDTTYNTNVYKMPFAPFTGVNHHRQSILFGCALLENETEETFTWLFETWLDAMGGKAPFAIITDQDPAMAKAIAKVFPYAHHRFCLWHIKKKFIEKLGYIYYKRSTFKLDVKRCTRLCHSTEEFEEQWADLLVTYGLSDNSWLQSLYAIRERWVPVYCQDTFWAGMSSTQRSESVNAFFDAFVNSTTDLSTFVTKFDQALLQIYVNERAEDYVSINKGRSLSYSDFFLLHAGDIYTRNLFVKFLEEHNATHVMRCDKMGSIGDVCTYSVWSRVGDTYKWIVTFNSTTKEGSCGCKLFEFYGLPCRHLLSIFKILYLEEIPTYFIAKRWMKKANRVQVCATDGTVMRSKNIGTEAARIFEICQKATQLAYMMCSSDEGFEKIREHIDKGFDIARDMSDVLLKFENNSAIKDDHPQGAGINNSNVVGVLLDPHVSKTKGRKKQVKEGSETVTLGSQKRKRSETTNDRLKSPVEKQKRKCKDCFGKHPHKHDHRNCPDNPINIKKKRRFT